MAARIDLKKQLPALLRELALRYPEVEEGIACAGTALESTTYKARTKAFLFLTSAEAGYKLRLKLSESQADAAKLAAKEPARYKLGAHGWATVGLSSAAELPKGLLEKWIDESYRALADKKLVAQLASAQSG